MAFEWLNECVWCSVELNKENKSEEWCDPCCKECARKYEVANKEVV